MSEVARLLVRGCRLPGRDGLRDVGRDAGRIAAVAARADAGGARVLDAGGRLLLPGFVNGWVHVLGGDDLEGRAALRLERAPLPRGHSYGISR
jgi:imidazolonepropionase-like amidohydrolase